MSSYGVGFSLHGTFPARNPAATLQHLDPVLLYQSLLIQVDRLCKLGMGYIRLLTTHAMKYSFLLLHLVVYCTLQIAQSWKYEETSLLGLPLVSLCDVYEKDTPDIV